MPLNHQTNRDMSALRAPSLPHSLVITHEVSRILSSFAGCNILVTYLRTRVRITTLNVSPLRPLRYHVRCRIPNFEITKSYLLSVIIVLFEEALGTEVTTHLGTAVWEHGRHFALVQTRVQPCLSPFSYFITMFGATGPYLEILTL